VVGVVLVLLLGMVAGALPALHAGRLRIVDALRRS
jgi:ABC-type antimicrobial peptide transport system permease subunit